MSPSQTHTKKLQSSAHRTRCHEQYPPTISLSTIIADNSLLIVFVIRSHWLLRNTHTPIHPLDIGIRSIDLAEIDLFFCSWIQLNPSNLIQIKMHCTVTMNVRFEPIEIKLSYAHTTHTHTHTRYWADELCYIYKFGQYHGSCCKHYWRVKDGSKLIKRTIISLHGLHHILIQIARF